MERTCIPVLWIDTKTKKRTLSRRVVLAGACGELIWLDRFLFSFLGPRKLEGLFSLLVCWWGGGLGHSLRMIPRYLRARSCAVPLHHEGE